MVGSRENNYRGVLVRFINDIIANDIYGVRTGILEGKKYCIKAGNAIWDDEKLVGVTDPEVNSIDYLSERDCYDYDEKFFYEVDDFENNLIASDDIIPLVAEYRSEDECGFINGDFDIIADQLNFSKNYVLGQEKKGTFAYAVKHFIGLKNLLILDKSVLINNWAIVKGYDEEKFAKIVEDKDVPAECCKTLFDSFRSDRDADYYANLPYLQEEAVLGRSNYLRKPKSCRDISSKAFTNGIKQVYQIDDMIRQAIYSVGIFCNPLLTMNKVDRYDVFEGSFCLLKRGMELYIASVSGNSKNLLDDMVVPVNSLPLRVVADSYDTWDFDDCLDCIYKFYDWTKDLFKEKPEIDIKAVFVFPCRDHYMYKVYLAKNCDDSYTLSLVVPYFREKEV